MVGAGASTLFFNNRFLNTDFIMNVKEFLNQAGSPIVYNIMGRTSSKGNPTFMLQLAQGVSRTEAGGSSRRNFLLAAGQGDLGARTATAILNMNEERANALLKAMGKPEITDTIKEEMKLGTVVIFRALETQELHHINDLDFFPTDVAIEITESPFQNPFSPNQEPVLNPQTGKYVEAVDLGSGEKTTYYAHTEIAPADTVSHQFINEFFTDENARRFPVSVMEDIARREAQTVGSAADEVTVSQ